MTEIAKLHVTLSADIKRLKTGLNAAKSELNKLKSTTAELRKELDNKAGPATSKFGNNLTATSKKIAAGLIGGMGVVYALSQVRRSVADLVNTGREFDREWANVTTMLDTSATETGNLKQELLNLSPTLGDTTELAKGMYQVLSASIEPAKAVRFLGEAAKSAKAGVTDAATAVDALTTVINAYGMKAEDVTKVSDVMFQAVKSGKLTYEELAKSIGTVVPVAAQVGISFEDVAAATATLTRQGIDAQTATMQLRQIMMAILKPSSEATKLAKKLGLEFNATALRTKGLVGFLQDLKEKTGGNAEKMATLIPNVRALSGVMALAGEQSEAFARDQEKMSKAAGSTDRAFKKQMESVDFWIEAAKNAFGKMKIAIFEGFIGPIKESIGSARDLEVKLDILSMKLQNLGKDIGSGIGTVVKYLDRFKAGLAGIPAFANNVANEIRDRKSVV